MCTAPAYVVTEATNNSGDNVSSVKGVEDLNTLREDGNRFKNTYLADVQHCMRKKTDPAVDSLSSSVLSPNNRVVKLMAN